MLGAHEGRPYGVGGIPGGVVFIDGSRRSGIGCRIAAVGLIDDDYPVDVVGHDDELVHCHTEKPLGHTVPYPADHLPRAIQARLAIGYLSEQRQPPLHRNGDEIRARLRVVEACQAVGFAAARVRGEFHVAIGLGAVVRKGRRERRIR